MAGLKPRARTLQELAEKAAFYVAPRPLALSPKAEKLLGGEARERLADLLPALEGLDDWSEDALEAAVRGFAESRGLKLGQIAQPLRAALTGSDASPGLFEVLAVLGRDEALARIRDRIP